ncbi:UdgX family uracil-DNA binding protein [Novosphingobium aerophilum]|uniref:Type-4 uracil-DNA glycosylase n=1 Tax=Novosphingobium aerophilum TaxID=2839843 RepID=A0A7X1KAW4_9SPHN|nr:UdgX family uracil-DNA binding protein [Novosphingobium aerophilum]MBC2650583.1 UdgX family uracil-DNA binding protein [Novosphingobium aerophilum]
MVPPASPLVVALSAADDLAEWRERARALIAARIAPDGVLWSEPGGAAGDLFAVAAPADCPPVAATAAIRAPRAFLQLAGSAVLHCDSRRFDLLYRLLWRLQRQPRLIEDGADPDVRRLHDLARAVRRDIHKMRAFVRFRRVSEPDGGERYVAWFEPQHHILRANARFFVNRFTAMRWTILTPAGSLDWDGATLREGPPATRADAPGADAAEDLWRTYYASIFNPARLKVGAMLKEMPRRYWKNLPEATLIPELIAGAQAREVAMVQAGAIDFGDRPATLAAVATGIAACRRCAIGCNGTRAVMGEGPARAALMIVGEQPGDVEEEQGRPFVGPAGRLLRQHLERAGIVAERAYVTNAVKHFKFEPRGPRRLHQSPTAGEIDHCRWWLDSERALVRPQVVLALGASAARGLLGRTVSVQRERARPMPLDDGSELWITTHPSYLLRLPEDSRAAEEERFAADLRAVAVRV